jgi:putative ABC transport system permease protein
MSALTPLRRLLARLAAFVGASRHDRDLEQEIESHVALQTDDYVRSGMTLDAARRTARLEFGSRASLAEAHRAERGLPRLDSLIQDVRYSLRVLRHRPGSSALAIVTMAVGLGATTSLLSVTYGVLLRPLPFPAEDTLVRFNEWREGGDTTGRPFMTRGTYDAWRAQSSTLVDLAGWNAETVTMLTPRGPERAQVVESSASLFNVLGVAPVVGTVFSARQEAPGDDRVAVLAFGTWQLDFGGRPDVVGQTVTIDSEPLTIVGVMPESFVFPDPQTKLWKPMIHVTLFSGVARLEPGVSLQAAAAEGTARSRSAPDMGRNGVAVFGSIGASHVNAVPLRTAFTEKVQPAILLVLASCVLLLVLAIVNVAGVQLARTASRQRELAIRTAIGASRSRIAWQVLIESVVMSTLAGIVGSLVALSLNALVTHIPADGSSRLDQVSLNAPLWAMSLGLTLIVGIACGIVPALVANRVNIVQAVADGQSAWSARLRSRAALARHLMMAVQIAVAAALLCGASIVTRSFVRMVNVDRGYRVDGLLTARLPFPAHDFTRATRATALDDILTRLGHTPGVTLAAASDIFPLIDLEFPRGFELASSRPGEPSIRVKVMSRSVSRDYLTTMGMRVVQGRGFGTVDTLDSLPVAVVNRTFVRRYLSDREPLGVMLPVRFSANKPDWQIVGVVDDLRNQRAGDPPQPELFGCFCQMPGGMLSDVAAIAVRTTGDPGAFGPTLRGIVHDVAPSAPLDSVITMDARLQASVAGPRLSMTLLGGFAAFAVLVIAIGLFGLLSFSVTQRSRELSIRAALGARRTDLVRLVLRQSVGLALLGAVVGVPIAIVVGRYYRAFLFDVSPADPATITGVLLALVAVACVASLGPAIRAARIDPVRLMK